MATKESVSNFQIVNALFKDKPITWDGRVSAQSNAIWEETSQLLLADDMRDQRNAIFDALINRIALTIFKSNDFFNPLSIFHRGSLEYGEFIQEIGADVIPAMPFQGGESDKTVDQFKVVKNEVAAVYHRTNRREFYKETIFDSRIKQAFISPNGFEIFINELLAKLTKSNTIDEFVWCKKVIEAYYKDKKGKVKSTQKIKVADITNNSISLDELKNSVIDIKKVLKKMTFPSQKFTTAGQVNQDTPNDLVLIMNSDATVVDQVKNLASAFNPQYMDKDIPIIDIDDFGENMEEVIGCMCSRRAFGIYNRLQTFTQADNAEALYRNYFLHIHQTYTASPFENVVFITK